MPHTVKRVAKRVGLPERTVRFYDTVGLVSPGRRTSAGYRLYDTGDEEKLRFAAEARRLGYPLEEIRGLIATADAVCCGRATRLEQARLDEAIEGIELRLADLAAFRDQLRTYRTGRGAGCGRSGHPAFCGCCDEPTPDPRRGGEMMSCSCCTPSRKHEDQGEKRPAERKPEPTLEERVATLERRLAGTETQR